MVRKFIYPAAETFFLLSTFFFSREEKIEKKVTFFPDHHPFHPSINTCTP